MPDAPPARRRWAGLGVGLLVLVVVAVPAGWTALLAYISFSGCFIECRASRPFTGTVWALITVALLACPVAAGLLTARGNRHPAE